MKKLQSILSSLLLIQLISYGQPRKSNSQLTLSIGPAFPIGQFANKDFYNEKAGLATVGAMMDISYLMRSKHKVGIAISLHGQLNPVARRSMEEFFSNVRFSTFGFSSTLPPTSSFPSTATYPNWKFKSSSWIQGSLMAGGYTECTIASRKLSVLSKAMIGSVYAISPKINGSSTTDTVIVQVTQSSESAFGFAYSISSNLKFKMNNRLNIITSIEFFGTNKITFKNIAVGTTISKYWNDPGRSAFSKQAATVYGKQSITSINLVAGLSFRL